MGLKDSLNKEINIGNKYPFIYPLITAMAGPLLLLFPLLGVLLIGLPTMPGIALYDLIFPGNFSETGQHVEIGFAWITYKTVLGVLFYVSFFFCYGLYMALTKSIYEKIFPERNLNLITTYILSVVVLWITAFIVANVAAFGFELYL